MIWHLDTEEHAHVVPPDASIGDELKIVVTARIAALESDLIDVSGYDKRDALAGKIRAKLLITNLQRAIEETAA